MTREILLITRVRTLNKGNQALSRAWVTLLEGAFPDAALRVLERRPRHLLQYRLSDLAKARDPYRAFDELTTKLAKLAPGPDYTHPVAETAEILLDENIPAPTRHVALRQRLNLRGLLARAGHYADEYRHRLSACQRASLVIVNPAGEFFPREPSAAFYHLLDADVARKLGVPTAIVNHTMDITDPVLRAIIPRLYRDLDLVEFRDTASVEAFEKMGGDLSNVVVAPDLALTTEFHGTPTKRAGTVAVAINAPEAAANGYLPQWEETIAAVRGMGLRVELISNEIPFDLPFYSVLQQRFRDLPIASAGLPDREYCALLAGYDLVITSRMHTAILAMVSGTPVVPVEGASFKITGLFRELGFDTPVIRPVGNAWPGHVVDEVQRVRAAGADASSTLATRIAAVRERIHTTLVPRLQSIAKHEVMRASA
jgi:polysaccharide pyruvyl transferase WcaK-like protein